MKSTATGKVQPAVQTSASGTTVTIPFQRDLRAGKMFRVTVLARPATGAPLNTPLTISAFTTRADAADGTSYCDTPADDVTVGRDRSCEAPAAGC